MNRYKTSLYVAEIWSTAIPLKVNVRKGVWKTLKELKLNEKTKFIENTQNIVYKNTLIGFKVRDLPEERKYLLSFFPYGQNKSRWGKERSKKAVQDILDFCNLVGDKISIITREGNLDFYRQYLSDDKCIDISEWEVSFKSANLQQKEKLSDFLWKTSNTRFEYIFKITPTGKSFCIFTKTFLNERRVVNKLKDFLKKFGKVIGPRSLIVVKEQGETLTDKQNTAFIFVETKNILKNFYYNLKIFFDNKRIATQSIFDETITKKMKKYPGVRANLILEIMTKLGSSPVVLKAPEEIVDTEGFLCLSNIESTTRRLFGALFMYLKEGLEVKEEVQIYQDIEFYKHDGTLEIPSDKIDILSKKISQLIGKRMIIDIILTMEWSKESLVKLINNLAKNGIKTNRVYYVSSKTSRYVDDYLTTKKNIRGYTHPYLKVSKKVAFLKSSTDIRIYANLSSLFIKLEWPKNAEINLKDLKKILWLVKKRTYRIQEFYVLKIPEPIQIFQNVRNMYLGEFKETLTIPLRLLI